MAASYDNGSHSESAGKKGFFDRMNKTDKIF